ncbi:hypothetical protein [Dactylosporangium sp. CA-092794]|uniref:hypothetical protein n=1 Tax=Dactylosporangium sp. CA-092794 TaxID=3239929 RepID=UPI003D8D52BE
MSKQVDARLADADPARGVPIGAGDADAVLRRAAADITAYPVAVADRPSRRAVLAVALAVVVVVAAAVALALPGRRPAPGPPPVQSPSGAATVQRPSGSASEPVRGSAGCLADLADRIVPAKYDGAPGRYEHLSVRTEDGITKEATGTPAAVTASWELDVQLWSAADGSGRRVADRSTAQYPDEASRAYFEAHPDALGPEHEDQTFGPAERPLRRLPAANPAAMAEELYRPREAGPSAALAGVADLNQERILDPEHRAALLRFLAATEGVTCGGEHQTEAGRGLVVSAPSGDNGAESLLFDTGTGELKAAGPGPGRWTTFYLGRGYTDRTS